MTNTEKINLIEYVIQHPGIEDTYYELLDSIGNMNGYYGDYLITEPIDCDKELKRLPDADFELCVALLTMLLREDHFANGSFRERYEKGQVDAILNRMLVTLR